MVRDAGKVLPELDCATARGHLLAVSYPKTLNSSHCGGPTDAVRCFLADELSNGHPRLEQRAPRLHMSARTLHRGPEQEERIFAVFLSEVRHELAPRHLAERRLTISEIAFLLEGSLRSAHFTALSSSGPVTHRIRRKVDSARSQRQCVPPFSVSAKDGFTTKQKPQSRWPVGSWHANPPRFRVSSNIPLRFLSQQSSGMRARSVISFGWPRSLHGVSPRRKPPESSVLSTGAGRCGVEPTRY